MGRSENFTLGYHSTHPDNTAGILAGGLQPSLSGLMGGKRVTGVFISSEPQADYGDDILEVKVPTTAKKVKNNPSLEGEALADAVSPENVRIYGHKGADAAIHEGSPRKGCKTCTNILAEKFSL